MLNYSIVMLLGLEFSAAAFNAYKSDRVIDTSLSASELSAIDSAQMLDESVDDDE